MEILIEILERILENVGGKFGELSDRFLGRVWPILVKSVSENVRARDVLALVLVIVLTIAPIGVFMGAHVAIKRFARRRARAFISFQHERESIADAIAAEMARSDIRPLKLPFVENPDHDTLLDEVKQAIRDCDVFVCIPGSRPSFVESEVSMAFGLEKPLLFVLAEADKPRLPNTAKKGYPVFALEQLQKERFRTLVRFCSYLAADWRSTIRLYVAVLTFMGKGSAILVVPIYILSLVVMATIMGHPARLKLAGATLLTQFVSDPAIVCFVASCLVVFLMSYTMYFLKRLALRARIRRVISAKMFSKSFLPKILEFSLAGEDLLKVLYVDDIIAEHQSNKSAVQNH